MNENTKIKSFTDLIAWQQGHKLVLMIYKIIKQFPDKEKFGLSSQISRAAVSITSNISVRVHKLVNGLIKSCKTNLLNT